MRAPLLGIAGLAAAGFIALSVAPSSAAPRAERELLHIRIWNKFSDVLNLYHQPSRIETGLITSSGASDGLQSTSSMSIPGAGGMMGAAMMGSGGGGPMGRMGSGGAMGGKMGMMSMMGSGGGMPGMGGGMMGSGGRGKMGGDDGPMGGMPGMSGMSGMPGMGGAMPGMSLSASGQQSTESEARQTWIYQHGPISNFFVFNKDGRVIQIESSGLSGVGGITAQGIKLGDSVSKVYKAYGWTSKIMKNGTSVTLDYTRESHVAFMVQDLKGRGPSVVGITVTLLDAPAPMPLGSDASLASAGGGMPGMMGGGRGMSSMMGSGGGMNMMGRMGRMGSGGGGKMGMMPGMGGMGKGRD